MSHFESHFVLCDVINTCILSSTTTRSAHTAATSPASSTTTPAATAPPTTATLNLILWLQLLPHLTPQGASLLPTLTASAPLSHSDYARFLHHSQTHFWIHGSFFEILEHLLQQPHYIRHLVPRAKVVSTFFFMIAVFPIVFQTIVHFC